MRNVFFTRDLMFLNKMHQVIFASKQLQRETIASWDTWLWRLSINVSCKNVLILQTEANKKKVHEITGLAKQQPHLPLAPGSLRAASPVGSLCAELAPQTDAGLHLQRLLKTDEMFHQMVLSHNFLEVPQPALDQALGSTSLTPSAHSPCF